MGFLAFDRIQFSEINQSPSTNDNAFEAIEQNRVPLIWTLNQTKGRGSRGRSWISPAWASLAMSLGLAGHPTNLAGYPPPPTHFPYPIFAGLAVHDALVTLFPNLGSKLRLKWPNDLVLGDKKLCGILCESRWQGSSKVLIVIGVGINLKQHPEMVSIPKPWTSLEQEGIQVDPAILVHQIAHSFTELSAATANQICASWEALSLWPKGLDLEVTNSGVSLRGRFMGLDESGGLELQLENGQIHTFVHADPDFSVRTLS